MAKSATTKDRLADVIRDDREERLKQSGLNASVSSESDQASRAERVAKNLALIRSYEVPGN